jgi:hypothetical protein
MQAAVGDGHIRKACGRIHPGKLLVQEPEPETAYQNPAVDRGLVPGQSQAEGNPTSESCYAGEAGPNASRCQTHRTATPCGRSPRFNTERVLGRVAQVILSPSMNCGQYSQIRHRLRAYLPVRAVMVAGLPGRGFCTSYCAERGPTPDPSREDGSGIRSCALHVLPPGSTQPGCCVAALRLAGGRK